MHTPVICYRACSEITFKQLLYKNPSITVCVTVKVYSIPLKNGSEHAMYNPTVGWGTEEDTRTAEKTTKTCARD